MEREYYTPPSDQEEVRRILRAGEQAAAAEWLEHALAGEGEPGAPARAAAPDTWGLVRSYPVETFLACVAAGYLLGQAQG